VYFRNVSLQDVSSVMGITGFSPPEERNRVSSCGDFDKQNNPMFLHSEESCFVTL